MSEFWNRILSGNTTSKPQLVGAAIFVVIWFAMDTIKFVDWTIGKFRPSPVVCIASPGNKP